MGAGHSIENAPRRSLSAHPRTALHEREFRCGLSNVARGANMYVLIHFPRSAFQRTIDTEEKQMNKRKTTMTATCGGLLPIVLAACQTGNAPEQPLPGEGFAAIPGQRGGQDMFGPYEVVPNWPKPMEESLPGHEGWTWSVTMDVFAESPDRVFLVQKGELPIMERPRETVWLPELGPGFHYPNFRLPMRQAGSRHPQWRPAGRAGERQAGHRLALGALRPGHRSRRQYRRGMDPVGSPLVSAP